MHESAQMTHHDSDDNDDAADGGMDYGVPDSDVEGESHRF